MARFIVANFDAEIEMARARTPGPHPDLPAAVRARLEALAPALAAIDRAAEVVSDPASVPRTASAVLGWAETPSIAAARAGLESPAPPDAPLWQAIAPADVAARVNDRRFWLELAHRRGWALPETAEITSVGELEARLPALVAASADGGWSVKAPLSAAGRERVHRWGAGLPGDIAVRVARMLERFGVLIAEPWMPRVADVGVAGLVGPGGEVETHPPHRLEVDRAGTFRAVVIDDSALAKLEPFAAAATDAGEALAAAGYRGPFGTDGFVYRTPGGGEAVAAVCEINARMTFGLVARHHRPASSPPGPFRWRP